MSRQGLSFLLLESQIKTWMTVAIMRQGLVMVLLENVPKMNLYNGDVEFEKSNLA